MPARKRLLLIEDDHDVADMLIMYFGVHQYEVLHADSGEQGVELARSRFPNLILLDVMLPDFDGYDVCQRLRATSFTRYMPIIFLTQRDERANKVKGLSLGADDYITKPFDIDELRLRVQTSIARATPRKPARGAHRPAHRHLDPRRIAAARLRGDPLSAAVYRSGRIQILRRSLWLYGGR
ncbi:MAG: response regulator [Chloroflexi bacterium]|uniref:response regulator n=1 Tax=Candidatus Flexifilum breve TaxID=3140694 RepID=UPI0031347036|nr:response regulator [Chloroflexota bacterium]